MYFNVHLFNNPQILLCSHCILCMISFSISYIYKYYLEANPYIHRSPPVAHTDWCVERTYKCAPTGAHQKRTYPSFTYLHLHLLRAHQKCTYRCATNVHLQVRTCRCTPNAHLQVRTYPSFTYLHPHQKRTYHCINVWTIQMTAHQTRTYMNAPTV